MVNGCVQLMRVASALASTHSTVWSSVSGKWSIMSRVCRRAQASAASCDGTGPRSTAAGSAASHRAAAAGASRVHAAVAAATAGCGWSSSSRACRAAVSAGMPSASASAPAASASAPVVGPASAAAVCVGSAGPPASSAAATSASNSHAPRGDATWWRGPTAAWKRPAYAVSASASASVATEVMRPVCPARPCPTDQRPRSSRPDGPSLRCRGSSSTPGTRAALRLARSHLDREAHRP